MFKTSAIDLKKIAYLIIGGSLICPPRSFSGCANLAPHREFAEDSLKRAIAGFSISWGVVESVWVEAYKDSGEIVSPKKFSNRVEIYQANPVRISAMVNIKADSVTTKLRLNTVQGTCDHTENVVGDSIPLLMKGNVFVRPLWNYRNFLGFQIKKSRHSLILGELK
jgi:hypothetical protein